MPLDVLLTRPLADAQIFAHAVMLKHRDSFAFTMAPLLEIRDEPCSVDLGGVQAVMFTSKNAVERFAARSPERHVPALCVGPATERAAAQAGFSTMSADGDVIALATLAAQSYQPGAGTMLHFRGGTTAGDLAGTLLGEGIEAEDRIIYEQAPQDISQEALALLQTAKPVLAPVFSPRTARLLASELHRHPTRANLVLIGLSHAVSAEFSDLSFKVVTAPQPNAASILSILLKLAKNMSK